MNQYFILTDTTDNSVYGIVVKSGGTVVAKGAHSHANEWASWFNSKSLSTTDGHLPVTVVMSRPRPLRSNDELFLDGLLDSAISGSHRKELPKKYVESILTNAHSSTPGVRDFHLASFDIDARSNAINFKALAFRFDTKINALAKMFQSGRVALNVKTGLLQSRIPGVTSADLQTSVDASLSRISQRRIGLDTNNLKSSYLEDEVSTKRLRGRLGPNIGRGLRAAPPGLVFVDVTGTIDADTDGIVFEGKPGLERPIIPRFTIPEALGRSVSAAIQGDAEENERLRRAGQFNDAAPVAKLRELLGNDASQITEIDATRAMERPAAARRLSVDSARSSIMRRRQPSDRLTRAGKGGKTQFDIGESRAVEKLSWDDDAKELIVTYNGGRTYTYQNVDDSWVKEIESNPDALGRILNDIKKAGYSYTRGGDHAPDETLDTRKQRRRESASMRSMSGSGKYGTDNIERSFRRGVFLTTDEEAAVIKDIDTLQNLDSRFARLVLDDESSGGALISMLKDDINPGPYFDAETGPYPPSVIDSRFRASELLDIVEDIEADQEDNDSPIDIANLKKMLADIKDGKTISDSFRDQHPDKLDAISNNFRGISSRSTNDKPSKTVRDLTDDELLEEYRTAEHPSQIDYVWSVIQERRRERGITSSSAADESVSMQPRSSRSSAIYSGRSTSGGKMPSWDDLQKMNKVVGPLGSNGGQWYEDPSTSRKFFAKPTPTPDHAFNESAVAAVYRAAGSFAPNIVTVTDSRGRHHVISEGVPNLQSSRNLTDAQKKIVKMDMGLDMLLSNWDVYGGGDNTKVGPNGEMYRLDTGGGGMYRARGGAKPSFNPRDPWVEPATMVYSPNSQSKYLYGTVTNGEFAAAMDKVANLDIDAIDAELRAIGTPDAMRKTFIDTIKARQKIAREYADTFSGYDPISRVNVAGQTITPGGNKVPAASRATDKTKAGSLFKRISSRSMSTPADARANDVLSMSAPEQQMFPEVYDSLPDKWDSMRVAPNTLGLIQQKRQAAFKRLVDSGMSPDEAAGRVIDAHLRSNMRGSSHAAMTASQMAAYLEYAGRYDAMLEDIDGWPDGTMSSWGMTQARRNSDRFASMQNVIGGMNTFNSARSVRWSTPRKQGKAPRFSDAIDGIVVSRGKSGADLDFEVIELANGRYVISGVERDNNDRKVSIGYKTTGTDNNLAIDGEYDSIDEAVEAANEYVDGRDSSYDDEYERLIEDGFGDSWINSEILGMRSATLNNNGLLDRPAHGFHYADFERMSDRQLFEEYRGAIGRATSGENVIAEVMGAQKALEDRRMLVRANNFIADIDKPEFDGTGRLLGADSTRRKPLASMRSKSNGNWEINMTLRQLGSLERDIDLVDELLNSRAFRLDDNEQTETVEALSGLKNASEDAVFAVDAVVVDDSTMQALDAFLGRAVSDIDSYFSLTGARTVDGKPITSEHVQALRNLQQLISAVGRRKDKRFVSSKLDELGSMHDIDISEPKQMDRLRARLSRIVNSRNSRGLPNGPSYISSRSRRHLDDRAETAIRDAFIESPEFRRYYAQFRRDMSDMKNRDALGIPRDTKLDEIDYISSPNFRLDLASWDDQKMLELNPKEPSMSSRSRGGDGVVRQAFIESPDFDNYYEQFRRDMGDAKNREALGIPRNRKIDQLDYIGSPQFDKDMRAWDDEKLRQADSPGIESNRSRSGGPDGVIRQAFVDSPEFDNYFAQFRRDMKSPARRRALGIPTNRELDELDYMASPAFVRDVSDWDFEERRKLRSFDDILGVSSRSRARFSESPDFAQAISSRGTARAVRGPGNRSRRELNIADYLSSGPLRDEAIGRSSNYRTEGRAGVPEQPDTGRAGSVRIGSNSERRRIATLERTISSRSKSNGNRDPWTQRITPGFEKLTDTDGQIWESLSDSDRELVSDRLADIEEGLIARLSGSNAAISASFNDDGIITDIEISGDESKAVSGVGNEMIGFGPGNRADFALAGTATELERKPKDAKEAAIQKKIREKGVAPLLTSVKVRGEDGRDEWRLALNEKGLRTIDDTFRVLRRDLTDRLAAAEKAADDVNTTPQKRALAKKTASDLRQAIAQLDQDTVALKTIAAARLKAKGDKNADGGDKFAYVLEQLPASIRREALGHDGVIANKNTKTKRAVFDAWWKATNTSGKGGKAAKRGSKAYKEALKKFDDGELSPSVYGWWKNLSPGERGTLPDPAEWLDEQGNFMSRGASPIDLPDFDLDEEHSGRKIGATLPGSPERYYRQRDVSDKKRSGGFWSSTTVFKKLRPNNQEWLDRQAQRDARVAALKSGKGAFGGKREGLERSRKELRILRRNKAERLSLLRKDSKRSPEEIQSALDAKRAELVPIIGVNEDGKVAITDRTVDVLVDTQTKKSKGGSFLPEIGVTPEELAKNKKANKKLKARNIEENEALGHLWDNAGFNGRPTIVTEDEFVEAANQPGAYVIRRGLGGKTFAEEYMDDPSRYITGQGGEAQGPGEYWSIRAIDGKRQGDGAWRSYVSADNQGGKKGTEPGPGGIMAVLPPSARIISLSDLSKLNTEIRTLSSGLDTAYRSPELPDNLRQKVSGDNGARLLELIDASMFARYPANDPIWDTQAGQILMQLVAKAKSASTPEQRQNALKALATIVYGSKGNLTNFLAPMLGYDAVLANNGVMLLMNRTSLLTFGGVGGLGMTDAVEDAVTNGERIPSAMADKLKRGQRVD